MHLTKQQGIVTAFLEILSRGAIPAFRPILLHLASPSPEPCTIHCTTGNNRSGVFTGILLSLLGVSPAVVAQEYALSELGLRGSRDAVVERLLGNARFREVVGSRERAGRMVGAREESMLALLRRVGEVWGGAEGYVRDVVGLGGEEIERVRDVLMDRS